MKHIKTFESFVTDVNEGVSVDTSSYKRTHMKEPRGEGMWAFEIKGKTVFTPGSMNYSDAVKWAKEEAAKEKASLIKVLG